MSNLKMVTQFYENGKTFVTNVNAQVSNEDIEEYFVGKYFDLGHLEAEDFKKCIKLEIQ